MATKRGRQSAASTAVRPAVSLLSTQRLSAPLHISDAEMAVWHEVVNDQPADAFTATHAPILEMYCRHVVNGRILADELINFDRSWLADDDGLKRYDKLLAMSERESRAASSLATRLRITRQAIDQQTVARKLNNHSRTKKPWELATVEHEE
jgi:hypothetical protein